MLKIRIILSLLTVCTLLIGSGCATRRLDSAMIHYKPENFMTRRDNEQLLLEARELLEFEISADDFRSTFSEEGHTCWIILTYVESAPAVIDRIKKAKGYQYLAVGQFDPQYRSVFGFKPAAETVDNDE